MIDFNHLLALGLLGLLWLTGAIALRRSLRDSGSARVPAAPPASGFPRTDLPNHAVRAWPGR
jgi:hypothetical protein